MSYDKTGGKNQALIDFGKMPGKSQAAGDGVLLKKYDGATLTYYPKATSTGTPTLQYPSSTANKVYDKVRYY